jgi:hypothetical protein
VRDYSEMQLQPASFESSCGQVESAFAFETEIAYHQTHSFSHYRTLISDEDLLVAKNQGPHA